MPVAHALACQSETRSGTLIVAEEQTAGRGRQAHRWEAPPGQALLVSAILKPPLPIAVSQLPMAVGVAAVDAIESFAPELAGRVGLKWPNDLLVGAGMTAANKVGGVLMETVFRGSELGYAVVGIGINVNQPATDLPSPQPGAPPPTSLRHFLDHHGHGATMGLDRTALLIVLCRSLAAHLTSDQRDGSLFTHWRRLLWTLGEAVHLFEDGVLVWQGRAIDVGEDGRLVVVNHAGEARRFWVGDVSVRTP